MLLNDLLVLPLISFTQDTNDYTVELTGCCENVLSNPPGAEKGDVVAANGSDVAEPGVSGGA